MKYQHFQVPVLLLIYNRPDVTKQVIQHLKKIKPALLYIAADGPNSNKANDAILCHQARKLVSAVPWKCQIKRLYQSNHLGCKIGVSTAITWFFNNVPEGIILEDDCVPNLSFFLFCQILLKKYRHSQRIMHISGSNFLPKNTWVPDSYYASLFPHVWGWATWKRAWKKYDVFIKDYRKFKLLNGTITLFHDRAIQQYFQTVFRNVYENRIDTWDYQWTYAIWKHHGLSITPKYNMVSNTGFDKNATHTVYRSPFAYLPVKKSNITQYPSVMTENQRLDNITFRVLYKPTVGKIIRHILFGRR